MVMLNCLQANLNNSRSSQDLLLQHILELNIDICIISEPSWPGNPQEWSSSLDGNSLIYVKSRYKKQIIRKRFLVAAILESLSVISVYISPNLVLPNFIEFLEEIKSTVNQLFGPIILCGDFNAHSKYWGSVSDNRRGTLVLDYMAEFGLRLVNEGNAFTCTRAQGNSIIDLTWASPSLIPLIQNWKVDDSIASLSDHLYITFGVLNKIPNLVKGGKVYRSNIGKMVEEEFVASIDWSMSTHREDIYSSSPGEFANWIVQNIHDALDFSTPKISGNVKRNRAYWWNSEIQQYRKKTIVARRIWTRCRKRLGDKDPHYLSVFAAYKKTKRDLKKLIRRAKGDRKSVV